jgi:hypothetical protein
MKQARVNALPLGPRKIIRPGSRVRLRGGGPLGIRGLFTVRAILRQECGRQVRCYLEGLTDEQQWATVYVAGPAYRRYGVRWVPQSVSIPR